MIVTKYPNPATCAHCGYEPLWMSDIQPMLGKYFSVICACGIHGPVAQSKPEAAVKWNLQAVTMKTKI